MAVDSKHPETLALHAGWRADPTTGAVAVPIYQTTSYQFRDTEHAADLFALKELGNIYTPHQQSDDRRARSSASRRSRAASRPWRWPPARRRRPSSIQNIARVGDNIVSSTDLYGGTWNLFANTLKDQGIEVRFVDPADPENFRRATDARTRAYYAETLPNPKLAVFPIAEVAAIGRELGIPLIIDNTAAPVLVPAARAWRGDRRLFGDEISRRPRHLDRRPDRRWRQFRLGSKFEERQPALNTPDPSYHGAIWTEAVKPLGPVAYIIKARTTLLRDLGASLSPFNAFLLLQGLETLPLRMRASLPQCRSVAELSGEAPRGDAR